MHHHRFLGATKTIAKLATPITLTLLSDYVLSIVDMVMIAQIGQNSLIAMGLAVWIWIFCIAIFLGLSEAIQTRVSTHFGRKDSASSLAAVKIGTFYSLTLGISLTVGIYTLSSYAAQALHTDPSIVSQMDRYLQTIALTMIPIGLIHVIKPYWNGINKPSRNLCITVLSHVLNVLFNWVLIFGKWGFPAMGIQGAALGTLLALTISAGIYWITFFYTHKKSNMVSWRLFHWDKNEMHQLFQLSWKLAIKEMLPVILLNVSLWMLAYLGKPTLAAAVVLVQSLIVLFLIANGFGLVSLSLVSQSIGSQDVKKARLWNRDVLIISIGLTLVLGVVGLMFAKNILVVFLKDTPAIDIAITSFRIICFMAWAQTAWVVYSYAVVAAGEAKKLIIVLACAQIFIYLPVLYWSSIVSQIPLSSICILWGLFQLLLAVLLVLSFRKSTVALNA